MSGSIKIQKGDKSEIVSIGESTPSIDIEGWGDMDEGDLADLLQHTAEFLRENSGEVGRTLGKDLTFKTIDTGQLFVLAHRS